MAEQDALSSTAASPRSADSFITKVFVADLEIPARIGVYSHERDRAQKLVFDIEASITMPERDSLDDTCDYSTLVEIVRAVVDEGHITLVETVAHRVASAILALSNVREVTVRVGKPGAVRETRTVGVIVLSRRNEPTSDVAGIGMPLAATQLDSDQTEGLCGS